MTDYQNMDYSNVRGVDPKSFKTAMDRFLQAAPLVDFDAFVLPRIGLTRHAFYYWRTGRTKVPPMFLWALKAIITSAKETSEEMAMENNQKFAAIYESARTNRKPNNERYRPLKKSGKNDPFLTEEELEESKKGIVHY